MSRFWAKFLGITLLIAGAIVFPMPIPFGAIMMAMGAVLVFGDNPKLLRFLTERRRRNPRVDALIKRLAAWFPRFMQRVIENTNPESPCLDSDTQPTGRNNDD